MKCFDFLNFKSNYFNYYFLALFLKKRIELSYNFIKLVAFFNKIFIAKKHNKI